MKRQKKPRRFGNPLNLHDQSRRSLPKSSNQVTSGKGQPFFKRPFRGRRFKFTWKKFFISLGVIFGVLVLSATAVFAYFVRELPNPKKIQNRTIVQSTQIVDRTGKPLYNIYGEENRTVVKNEDISENIKKATVAVEDDTFYQNHGFNIKGIVRAALVHFGLLRNREGGGGSSITQQYVKNALRNDEYSLTRKIKELILAIEVEQLYSKDEILTGYLNEIPYGGGAYGIEAASQLYFGKSANELTVSEAATLAAIPQLPTYYSPYGNHLDDLFTRKDYILDRMAENSFITQAEADEAKTAAPSLDNPAFKRSANLVAPHFVFYVREKLIESLDPDPQVAEKMLDEGGFKVTTSLDLDTQNMAQQIVSEMGPDTIKKYGATNASLTAVDPKTGEILAMVGSIDYENSKSGNTNYANALLQPGSSFKPIVYATAFGPKYKYAPGTITYDVATDFGAYKPNNYDGSFHGAITNRQALAGSLNIPAVKNLALAGVKDSIDTAKALGVTTLNRDPGDYGLSLVLGSGEVRPVEMAGAYAGFANGGMYNALRPILKIEKDNEVVQDFTTTEAKKAVEPEVAYEISNILSDNNARSYVFGTRNNLTLPDRPVAAKSGTTENNRDAWTIGYTPSISVAVWVGNNEPNKTMVKGADGSYVAAPIWNKFMRQYLTGKPVEQFTRPESIKEMTVDKLSGKLPTDQSPTNERVTDIFAPWQVPKENDDIHVKVRVVKGTNKLATDLTPPDMVEERIYFTIHSEQPDKPNWEQPVQAWARGVYGDRVGSPPKESDDIYVEGNRPGLSFVSPASGAKVSGTFTIEVAPSGTRPISQVEFFINNVSVGKATSAPWSISYDASNLPAGTQTLQATVTNDLGLTKTDQITITTDKDNSPPGNVSNPVGSNGKAGVTPIRLTWNNPSSAKLASVYIYQSTDINTPGDRVKVVPAQPGTIGTADLTPPAGKYYYTFRTVDTNGNQSPISGPTTAQMLP